MIFSEKVYALVRKIPKGKVTTYGEIAKILNSSPRAVGQALRCNPYALEVQEGIVFPSAQTGKLSRFVPCHRVVCSDGKAGGFRGRVSAEALAEKIRLLKKEKVGVTEKRINLTKSGFKF